MSCNGDFVSLSLRSFTCIISPMSLPKHEVNAEEANGHVKVDVEKPIKLHPYTKYYKQLRKLGVEEVVFSMEEYTNWSSSAK